MTARGASYTTSRDTTEGFDTPDLKDAKALLDELPCVRSWHSLAAPVGLRLFPVPVRRADLQVCHR